MREFDDARADRAFLLVSRKIAAMRAAEPDITNEELAYALLLVAVCSGEMTDTYFDFLRSALADCIEVECDELAGVNNEIVWNMQQPKG